MLEVTTLDRRKRSLLLRRQQKQRKLAPYENNPPYSIILVVPLLLQFPSVLEFVYAGRSSPSDISLLEQYIHQPFAQHTADPKFK